MNKNNTLITGTASGLGRYLKKKLNGISFDRRKKISFYKKKKWNLIIHCGFYTGNDANKIFESIEVSNKISLLKSSKIIFISSLIVFDKKDSLYKYSKIISESFFMNKKNSYIIRLGSIIGPDMRHNTISKILFDKKPIIGLSKKSKYSFTHYDEVYFLIKKMISQKKIYVTEFFRRDFASLEKISKKLNKKVKFGNYLFNCIDSPNKKKKIHFHKIIKEKSSIDILKKIINDK